MATRDEAVPPLIPSKMAANKMGIRAKEKTAGFALVTKSTMKKAMKLAAMVGMLAFLNFCMSSSFYKLFR